MPARVATTHPPRSGAAPRPRPARLPAWGWLEWFVVTQAMLPALLFIPGASAVRIVNRIASFALALVAWAAILQSGRREPPGRPFAPAAWLKGCAIWVWLMVLHPNTNSPISGSAQAALYLTILSPAFWAPRAMRTSRQLSRLMMIVFLCSIPGTLLGIAQARWPSFNPEMPALSTNNELAWGSMSYLSDDGRRIVRPCGLSDNPGGAASSGLVTSLIGLCLALRPIAAWKRLGCLALSLAGMAVIYFCQIRSALVMEFLCIAGLAGLFALRGNVRAAALLAIGSGVLLAGATAFVVATVGRAGIERFTTLLTDKPAELYHNSRGSFVEQTFNSLIWEAPLGSGMGRWGTMYDYFGDKSAPRGPNGLLWCEVQWPAWVIDGGVPLMVGYVAAVALALLDSIRIALRSRDRELSFWAALVCALNVGVLASCFSACPFLAAPGLQFWLLSASLNAAERRRRAEAAGRPA